LALRHVKAHASGQTPHNDGMKLLLIHQNFPGQFRRMAPLWARVPGWDVVGLGRDTAPGLPGVRCHKYTLHREVGAQQHHYLQQMERAVLHAQAAARAMQQLKRQGWVPDVIFAHPGWGETLYAREVFPNVRILHFCEWFYGTEGSDINFDPEFPTGFDGLARQRTWNGLHLLNLQACDAGVSPTQWQKSRHPEAYQARIHLAHEGVDTDLLQPDAQATFPLPNGTVLRAGDPVITYVARNLEPYRGFHSFMRALPRIQAQHPRCQTVIVGGDEVSYGSRPPSAPNWREHLLKEVQVDPARTHFLGQLPHEAYRRVLQVSSAHVYLTYPFVLSWSMLEAMSSGCLLIGSRTAPVGEVIRHGDNGLLVDFFDTDAMADQVVQALERAHELRPLRVQARADVVARYSLAQGDAAYRALLRSALDSR
jgi:glycosyltransferase involved in cell wall biosynthesis